jgi:hypothetical protein
VGELIIALRAHQLQSKHPPFQPENGPYAGGALDPGKLDFCWRVLKCEITAQRVVCAGIQYGDQYKHYVAIYGFQECGPPGNVTRYVYVLDPENDPSPALLYEQFAGHYQYTGTWVEMDRIKGDSACP